ncbi:MAG: AbiV family abortive infection protein [Fulvivirga sp.]
MDKDSYIKGFRLTFENAQRLFNASITLEEKNELAIANSLLVLCAEEGMKAYTIITQHFYPEKILEDFDKSFEDHKHKLEAIRSITGISQMFKKFGELYYYPIIENIIESKENAKKLKDKSFQNLLGWLKNEVKSNDTELAKQNIWWKHAKTMKENGFYVGYNKGHWTNPSSIKKENYLKTKKYVSEFLSQIEVLYNLDYNDKSVLDLIAEMKDKIKDA